MPAASSIRARVRAEMTAEIKATARRHLETDGANLSLRAVARDMGMVSSAVYRYFASRDELLTALIVDAYNALGETVEAADAAVADRSQLRQRWMATARAVREWALAHQAEYALLFGSPVPGYAAPDDTIAAAARTPVVLLRILADGAAAGTLAVPAEPPEAPEPPESPSLRAAGSAGGTAAFLIAGRAAARLTDAVRADLERARGGVAVEAPDATMLAGIAAWTQLFGMVSFELFGQFNRVIESRPEFFDQQAELMADVIGV
jgi:AcrR family transcriptional regulator